MSGYKTSAREDKKISQHTLDSSKRQGLKGKDRRQHKTEYWRRVLKAGHTKQKAKGQPEKTKGQPEKTKDNGKNRRYTRQAKGRHGKRQCGYILKTEQSLAQFKVLN